MTPGKQYRYFIQGHKIRIKIRQAQATALKQRFSNLFLKNSGDVKVRLFP